jgi:crotonobetainyl-CoA:carnitine CoA-transferase CaiB-like acyl-CoA transferase
MERVQLDAASLRARKPGLIHASITGFGRNGPSRSRPGLDIAAQAESGMMSITGERGGDPLKVGFALVDVATASATANAILAALFHRAMQGEGDTIEVSLLAVAVQLQAQLWAEYQTSGQVPQRVGNCQPKVAPGADLIAVADGHLVISATTEAHWLRLCTALGQPQLAEDPRFADNASRVANRPALLAAMGAALGPLRAEDARELLERHGVVVGVVRSYPQVLDSADVQASGIFAPVDVKGRAIAVPSLPFALDSMAQAAAPGQPPARLPELGEHTAAVLAELGYAAADIAQMHQAGAIGLAPSSTTDTNTEAWA